MREVRFCDILNVCLRKTPAQLTDEISSFAANALLEALNGFEDEESEYAEECREHLNECILRVNRCMKVEPPSVGWFAMYGSDIHTAALTYNSWLEAHRILSRYTES